jgi:hypothetical protein
MSRFLSTCHTWIALCALDCHGTAASGAPTAEGGETASASTTASAQASPPNALGMPSANIAAVVNPMNLPVYTGATGSVEGMVLVRGPDAPDVPNLDVRACPAALDTYGKLFRAGARRADGLRPLADAIVVVTGYSGHYLPEKNEVQRVTIGASCGYQARSIALTFGQRLDVANDSALPFAPYLEGAPQLTRVAPPRQSGAPAQIFPPRSDYFPLRDQLQKFVRVDVYVLRQPLHAITDTQGRFRIDGVPTGKLKASANLASILGDAATDVVVRAGGVENVELVLTYAPKDAGTAKK